jgi:hypothetical protein
MEDVQYHNRGQFLELCRHGGIVTENQQLSDGPAQDFDVLLPVLVSRSPIIVLMMMMHIFTCHSGQVPAALVAPIHTKR